jgi:hypothetical protein
MCFFSRSLMSGLAKTVHFQLRSETDVLILAKPPPGIRVGIGVGKRTFVSNEKRDQTSWRSTQSQGPNFFYLGSLNFVSKSGVSDRTCVWLSHAQCKLFLAAISYLRLHHITSPHGVKCCPRAPSRWQFFQRVLFSPLPHTNVPFIHATETKIVDLASELASRTSKWSRARYWDESGPNFNKFKLCWMKGR